MTSKNLATVTTATNFVSSKDTNEEQVMHSKSDNMGVMTHDNANKAIEEIFELLFSRYQFRLETSMRGSDFIFDGVNLLYYKCHKVNCKRGNSYTDSPDWIKKKTKKINLKNEDDKCFQYAGTVSLNCGKIKWGHERASNIKPFINKYNWDRIKYPSKIEK